MYDECTYCGKEIARKYRYKNSMILYGTDNIYICRTCYQGLPMRKRKIYDQLKDEVDRIFEESRIKSEESEKMHRRGWIIISIIFLPTVTILPWIFVDISISPKAFNGILFGISHFHPSPFWGE